MFKIKFIYLLVFIVSINVNAQSYKKRLAVSKAFLQKVRMREVLDTMLWKRESQLFDNTEKLFKQNKLDVNNPEDYEFFQSGLMHQFLFSKRHIIKRVTYNYQHIDYALLQKYVNRIDKGQRQKVIYESGLYDMLNKLLDQEFKQIKKMTMPKYIEFLVNKHKPVKLNLRYNNKPVNATDLDMDVIVETNNADYRSVSILDKKNNQILKPEGYTYEQIQKIIVKFKGQNFEFKPDSIINYYPRQFKELNSMISKYSFNQIPVWDIEIAETNGHVGVKLTNVVESKIIKAKPVQQELEQKDKPLDNK